MYNILYVLYYEINICKYFIELFIRGSYEVVLELILSLSTTYTKFPSRKMDWIN